MKLLLILSGFLLAALPFGARGAASSPDSLLTELNRALDHQKEYDAQRLSRINILRAAFASYRGRDNAKFDLGLRLYEEYKAFKYDSAFVYSQKIVQLAEQLQSPQKTEVAKLKLAFILLSSGMFKETFETLGSIRPAQLTAADKQSFYFLKARAYSDLADFNEDLAYRPTYNTKALACADTALHYSQPGSYERLSVQEFIALKTGKLQAGIALYEQIRRLPRLSPHDLAVSASTTAYLYVLLNQEEKAFELLLLAAIADVETATKETVALLQLSDYCYRRGDLKNAYIFIKEAREQAAFYKARQRQIEISHVSSLIEGQKINIIERQRRAQTTYSVVITLLAVSVLAFAYIIFKQLRKLQKAGRLISATNCELHERNGELRELNSGLNEANKIKEEYIGYYFHNNSQYIDKTETLKKKLDALLDTKQYAGVQKLVNGINIKNERHELLKGFDTVFLRLFPHFITQFNALFREEDRIALPEDHLLTTELRIFALTRLGISDSEQISRMLGYSINTIYTYKTRVRNRSFLPNEEFEAAVQAIQAV